MKFLLPLAKQQELELIELLLLNGGELSYNELREGLKISSKTLNQLIVTLNRCLEEHQLLAVIEKVEHQLVLIVSETFHLKRLYQHFYEESDMFNILKYMLLYGVSKMATLSEELFLARSSITRKSNYLKAELVSYGINLSNRPLRLEGDEYNVIMFYSSLFWDVYGGIAWPFSKVVSREKICQIYDQFACLTKDGLEDVEKEQFLFQLAVLYLRIRQRSENKIETEESFVYTEVNPLKSAKLGSKLSPLKQCFIREFSFAYKNKIKGSDNLIKDLQMFLFLYFQKPCDRTQGCLLELKHFYFSCFNVNPYEKARKLVNEFDVFFANERIVDKENLTEELVDIMVYAHPIINGKLAQKILGRYFFSPFQRHVLFEKKFNYFFEKSVRRDLLVDVHLPASYLRAALIGIFTLAINMSKYELGFTVKTKLESSGMFKQEIGRYLEENVTSNYVIESGNTSRKEADLIVTTLDSFDCSPTDQSVLYVSSPMVAFDMRRIKERIVKLYEAKLEGEGLKISKNQPFSAQYEWVKQEHGATLVEILVAIVILSLVITTMASFFISNQQALAFNTKLTEAQSVKLDVKEWLMNRGVSVDVGDINWTCFTGVGSSDPQEVARSRYILLDDTGFVVDPATKVSEFGEKKFRTFYVDVAGNTVSRSPLRKVTYENVVVPAKLSNLPERLGYYRDNKNFMIGARVVSLEESVPYGLDIQLTVYDSASGEALTDTYFKWVIINDSEKNPIAS